MSEQLVQRAVGAFMERNLDGILALAGGRSRGLRRTTRAVPW
jgi:hypothetical protein